MLFTSTPMNKNIYNNKKEESKNAIINSEININNNPLLLKSKVNNINNANSIEILNPFDSIASKKIKYNFNLFQIIILIQIELIIIDIPKYQIVLV